MCFIQMMQEICTMPMKVPYGTKIRYFPFSKNVSNQSIKIPNRAPKLEMEHIGIEHK